jgi:hypothetical protein
LKTLTSTLVRIYRSPDLIFYGGAFLIFLLIGSWGGRLISSSSIFKTPSPLMINIAQEAPTPADLPATGQRNLLVIGVDYLSASQPQLESVWLVMYFPGKLDFTFMPLYPQPADQKSLQDSTLVASFSQDEAGRPSKAFLQQLTSQAWWNNYLVLDQDAMIALIDLVGGFTTGEGNIQGAKAIAGIAPASQDASAAYYDQASLLSNLCLQIQIHPPSIESIVATFRKLEANMVTDLDIKTILEEQPLVSRANLNLHCDFPLLTSSVP